jgi:hypothetical protein
MAAFKDLPKVILDIPQLADIIVSQKFGPGAIRLTFSLIARNK